MNSEKCSPLSWLPWPVAANVLMLFVAYMLCRVAFVLENIELFVGDLSLPRVMRMAYGGLVFDTSAIFYTNIVYIVLAIFPLHIKEIRWWRTMLKFFFLGVNGVCIASCIADSVYYPFGLHRTNVLTFAEFGGNTNMPTIIGLELVRHWYLTLLFIAIITSLGKMYQHYIPSVKPLWSYYLSRSLWLIVAVPLSMAGMRGGMTTAIRPIAVGNAYQYVDKPLHTGIVLNTPFSIIRTIGKDKLHIPTWYTQQELDAIYTPVHTPDADVVPSRRNIVLLIVESFAQEFIGFYNHELDNGTYCGYTNFFDSLLPHCLTYNISVANADVSIDAIPAVAASVPRLLHSFATTSYALNTMSGLASELRSWGYSTAFFHGAENSSMGFQAMARSTGFEQYYGRTEYEADPRFGGKADFDGTWAIWDEPFLQFFAAHLDDMQEPFCSALFTASSHHPFALPKLYRGVYKDEGKYPIHKCLRYTDNALRRFFDTARTRPWYNNTIFVIVADHASSRITHDVYKTPLGMYRVPIAFYDPSGKLPTGVQTCVSQQIDIMPTLLGMVGYNRPFVAFGRDLLKPSTHIDSLGWAFNYTHIPQYMCGDYLLQFDAEATRVEAVYNYVADPLFKLNINGQIPQQAEMERHAKAFMQSCYERMRDNKMTIKK